MVVQIGMAGRAHSGVSSMRDHRRRDLSRLRPLRLRRRRVLRVVSVGDLLTRLPIGHARSALVPVDREHAPHVDRDSQAMHAYETQGQVVRLVPGQKEHLQLQLSSGE